MLHNEDFIFGSLNYGGLLLMPHNSIQKTETILKVIGFGDSSFISYKTLN